VSAGFLQIGFWSDRQRRGPHRKAACVLKNILGNIAMAKPDVSRDAFRSLLAFYAAKAHHDQKHDGEHSLLKLFGSTEDIPDSLLEQWSDCAELLGPETIGGAIAPRTRQITDGNARYDHASDFLHVLLRDLERKH
jgi:hypothetical protein